MVKAKTKSLLDAKGDDTLGMEYDNCSTDGFWILNDGYTVTVAAQKPGEAATAKVHIPVKEFRKLIRAYIKQQKFDPKLAKQ